MSVKVLGHGQFYGCFQTEVEAGGFTVAHIRADPHRDVQRHTHDAAHFIFVTRGPYVTAAAGAPDVCTEPVLVYNPPGTTHRDRFLPRRDGGFDGTFVSISVTGERWAGIAGAVPLTERATVLDATFLGMRLVHELARWEPFSPLVAEAVCLELMAGAARVREEEKSAPPWLALAREMLRDGAPSIGEIAHACGVHPVHLARTFRRFFGCSPGTYLRRARVERAAAMLRGRESLAEVALRCGFADQSHMTHAFRAILGTTPRALRAQQKVARAQDAGSAGV